MTTRSIPKLKPFITAAMISLVPSLSSAQSNNLAQRDAIPGQLLVQYKERVPLRAKALVEKKTKIKHKSLFSNLGIEHWVLEKASDLDATLQTLNADPNVEFAEPNYRRYPRAQPFEGSTNAFLASQKVMVKQIGVDKVWDPLTTAQKSATVTVAVIDDAFNIDHPDFRDNTDITNINLPGSRDFVDGDSDPSPGNCPDPAIGAEEHGTQVAGIIGARTDNGKGISGIPWNVNLIVYRIGCEYGVAAEAKAIDAAIAAQVNIINASYGGPMYSNTEYTAIKKLLGKGILFVSAAGNKHIDNDMVLDYPSALDLPNIISIASTTAVISVGDTPQLTNWTQFGGTKVDVAAPGEQIVSLLANGTIGYVSGGGGTSFSAAIVSGVAALLVKATNNVNINYRDLKGALMASATPLTGNLPHLASGGQIDANAALNLLRDPNSNPVPVIVINQVKFIDDTNGDGDKQIDVGERGNLQITVENVWKDATNLTLTLSSEELTSPVVQTISSLRSEEKAAVVFNLNKALLTEDTHRRALFSLAIEGSGPSAKTFSYQREFLLELGALRRDVMVKAKINAPNSEQDEVHLYHFNVPAGLSQANIELIVNGSFNTPLSILVRRDTPPQFEFGRTLATLIADPDTKVALAQRSADKTSDGDFSTQITLEKPAAGTYYVAVTIGEPNRQDVEYHLTMSYPRRSVQSRGCSSASNNLQSDYIDPTLPALLFLALIYIVRFRTRFQ